MEVVTAIIVAMVLAAVGAIFLFGGIILIFLLPVVILTWAFMAGPLWGAGTILAYLLLWLLYRVPEPYDPD